MALSLNFGDDSSGDALPLSGDSDLVKFLKNDVPAVIKLASDPSKINAATLEDAPLEEFPLKFSPTAPLSWDLGTAGNVTFGFSPTAKGSISIAKSGTLFKYKLGDDDETEVCLPVPDAKAYVSITLTVSLGVSAGASFSAGNVGVSGKVSSDNTFDLTFRKAFDRKTNAKEAIHQAFQSFRLPFQPTGVSGLEDGDYLEYDYCGKIATGFGATYGVTCNLIGGRSAGEVSQSFDLSPLGKAVASAQPTFTAGPSFAVEYEHTALFHVIVERSVNGAALVYFRSQANEVETKEALGIQFDANADFDFSSNLPEAAKEFAENAFSNVSGATGSAAATGLGGKLAGDISGQTQKFIDDVNGKIGDLLAKGNDHKVQLQFRQEQASTDMALFRFEFNLAEPAALAEGYGKAISGDFQAAMQVPGVTLDPGGYVENLWTQSTAVSFEFFDLFKASDVMTYYHSTKLVYAGHNTFRLVYKTGVKDTATVSGKGNTCEAYFTATAPEPGMPVSAGDLDVTLNFTMCDQGSAAAQETKRALIFIGGPELQQEADKIADKLTGSLKVNCRFSQAAFGRFDCDEYQNNKPSPLPHPVDAANYTTFIAAVHGIAPADNVNKDFLRFFASYDSWVEFNRVKIDEEGSDRTPDRRQRGNAAVNAWPDARISVDNAERSQLQCYIYSAQEFMNLCEALKHLGRYLSEGEFDSNFDLLTKALDGIISQDIPVFFIKPTLAALFRLAQSSASDVRATQSGKDMKIEFAAGTTGGAARMMTA